MTPFGFSLAATIDHLAPRLPAALVTSESLDKVRRLAESLPASLTSWIDFECRLHGARSQVDLSVRVDARGRDRLASDSLARHASSGSAAWRRVVAFAHDWATAGTPAACDVDSLWLEFDLDRVDAAASPRLFIDFARGRRARSDHLDRILNALAPIAGGVAPGWLREGAGVCLRNLPAGTELLYIGLPADERVTAVRLCVLGIDEHRAADYLEAVGWPGDLSGLRRACSSWDHDATRAAILHVDVTDRGLGSRIGLEFPFRRRPQVKGVVADTQMLADLVARGACAPDKRDALLTWPGCELSTLPHAIWPSLVLRRISHVKIVFDNGAPPEAKAYLCVAHAWRPDLRGRSGADHVLAPDETARHLLKPMTDAIEAKFRL